MADQVTIRKGEGGEQLSVSRKAFDTIYKGKGFQVVRADNFKGDSENVSTAESDDGPRVAGDAAGVEDGAGAAENTATQSTAKAKRSSTKTKKGAKS
jgi:hypothetical protein